MMSTFFRKKWVPLPDPPTPWRVKFAAWRKGFKDRFYKMSKRAWIFVVQWTIYLTIVTLVGFGGYLLWMYANSNNEPIRCWIEFKMDRDDIQTYRLMAELEWAPDRELGRFIIQCEAIEMARANGCSLPGDTRENDVEQTDR